ncbi:MAG: LPS export ABC transporter periplasmic protein LptC [Bacteroidetes bacterium GWA2_30_7]|nr:MAG: LPS export ABC transporter periplasmic protein LptC [Bacteroidetes bacterium GWA2_30_7]
MWLICYKEIIAIAMISFCFSCENELEKVNFFSKEVVLPNQSAIDIEVLYSEDAVVQLKLTAPVLEHYNDEEEPFVLFPKGIHVYFFNSKKEIESELQANYAKYFEKKKLWEARDDVRTINEKCDLLNTEQLFWNENKETIYSDKFVKITTAEEVLFGDGFESNQNFTKYQIKKLKGVISLKDE